MWARSRLLGRYSVGSMVIESSDMDVFAGLHTEWTALGLGIRPRFQDPWGSVLYEDVEIAPVKPWGSWLAPATRVAIVRGMLARCYYYSNSDGARIRCLSEAFCILIFRGHFPRKYVSRIARDWGRSWKPRGQVFETLRLSQDVECALSRLPV